MSFPHPLTPDLSPSFGEECVRGGRIYGTSPRGWKPLERKTTWFPHFSTVVYLLMFRLPGVRSYFLKTQNLLLETYFSTCVALMRLSVQVFCQLQPRGGVSPKLGPADSRWDFRLQGTHPRTENTGGARSLHGWGPNRRVETCIDTTFWSCFQT